MIKHYEGNGLNKVYFSSTGREYEIFDEELREISEYTSELEDKVQKYKFELRKCHIMIEELTKINNKLQAKGLL